MNGNKKSLPVIIIIMLSFVLLCGCSGNGSTDEQNASSAGAPDKHTIPYDESMESIGDDLGADSFDSFLDEAGSNYYVINDYYNMKSGGGLHIIPE